MSDQEIRSAETDESSQLVNEDGERLIQMLSVIASNVDRAYPGTTEDPTSGATIVHTDPTSGATVVTAHGQNGLEQMSNLLTAITVSSANGHPQEGLPTIVQVDQNIAMVQQEVVVGTPDPLSLDVATDPAHHNPDGMQTVSIQPISIGIQPLTTTIPLEEVHALQVQHEKEHLAPAAVVEDEGYQQKHKKMLFMTNYRDYTITDTNGRISIGERKYLQEACKMVPVTDISTGHKFEYQYRARGTVRRFEDKRMVIYFIGQISNERILALFYQTVFQLVCKVGKIDLDKDYTSGKRVLSTYFSAFGPSKARTMRTPIEKLTYMKLLVVGDVDDEENDDCTIINDGDDGEPVKPSEKLKKSKVYKEVVQKKRGRPKSVNTLQKRAKKVDHQSQEQTPGTKLTPRGSTPVVGKRPRGRPPKKRPTEVIVIQGGAGDGQGGAEVRVISQSDDPSQTEPSTPANSRKWLERGSSKRKVKRPSKLSDYYDFTKKIKMEPGSDEEHGELSDKEDSPPEEVGPPTGDSGLEDSSIHDRVNASPDEVSVEVSQSEEVNSSESLITSALAESVQEVHTIISAPASKELEQDELEEDEVVENMVEDSDEDEDYLAKPKPSSKKRQTLDKPGKKKPSSKLIKTVLVPVKEKIGDRIITRIVERKKRGRGRPRKHPKEDESEQEADIIVSSKQKYPSCHFQRAQSMKRYLCQACLTNHDSPVEEGEISDNCPIVNAKLSFKDQTATPNSTACSLMSLPTSLSVKVSPETRKLTVCAGQDIPAHTEFGPLVGILLSEDDIQIDTDLTHVWFLQQEEDSEKFYLYTGDENASNWCHYLNPVSPGMAYNMVMVLREEGIFFTTSQRITAGSELKVYVPYFGTKTRPVAAMTQSECLHCKRSFQSSLDYQKHYHIFHPGGFTKQKQKCRLCNRSFPGMKDLRAHMDEKHEGQGAFQCDQCTGTFPNPARLRIHQRDVHPPPEAAVTCDKCGKEYRSKRALANHNTNVHSQFKFACEVCGKWFDRRSTLLRHQRLHTGKFSHFCDRCGKGFRDLHNLKVHTLTHSGVRPFSCIYCQNCSFSTRTCLKIHYERFHSLTEDAMPELTRTIPFTLEAYSGNLLPVDKPAPRRQTNKRPKTDTPKTIYLQENQEHRVVGTVEGVRPGESLLRIQEAGQSPAGQSKEVHLHIEDDSTMHIEQVVSSENLTMVDMPMVVEEVGGGSELVETEQVTEGDHCYYALNVDGQQVLVPATEEVCVIVEDDNNIITLPSKT